MSFKVGQTVIAGRKEGGYYSGKGTIKAIQKMKVQFNLNKPARVKKMIAVYFPSKGTIWFESKEIRKA